MSAMNTSLMYLWIILKNLAYVKAIHCFQEHAFIRLEKIPGSAGEQGHPRQKYMNTCKPGGLE
jgi:hypothetical protein